MLAAATHGNKIQVWDWKRRKLLREFVREGDADSSTPQKFSEDGAHLIVQSSTPRGSAFRELEISTGRETLAFDGVLGSGLFSLYARYAPDGKQILIVRRIPAGIRLVQQVNAGGPIDFEAVEARRPEFSPDGRVLGIPSTRGHVRLFAGDTFQPLPTLSGFMHGVHSLAFSTDGRRLATGGTSIEAVTVWETQSRERLLTLSAKEDQLTPVVVSPDGNVLAGESGAGTTAGTLRFWRAPSWAEIEKAEAAERAGVAKP